jgi:hypothetical protein
MDPDKGLGRLFGDRYKKHLDIHGRQLRESHHLCWRTINIIVTVVLLEPITPPETIYHYENRLSYTKQLRRTLDSAGMHLVELRLTIGI